MYYCNCSGIAAHIIVKKNEEDMVQRSFKRPLSLTLCFFLSPLLLTSINIKNKNIKFMKDLSFEEATSSRE